jgi:hypothetical protein
VPTTHAIELISDSVIANAVGAPLLLAFATDRKDDARAQKQHHE